MTSLNRDFTGSNFPGSDLHQDDLRTESLQTLQQYMSPPSGNLMDYDWDQLQEEYIASMEKHENAERDLRNRVAKLLEIFMAWSETTVMRDEIRALKRFKTQMKHVQTSEEDLELKRKHYVDVVKAFESALALLNDRLKS
ncbi:uncharacterized protein AKAW2_70730A [Aspergillus luchuensis]|uniref:Uncharacterized protein n=3 Tax=Aspergillus subgen. Circumdati TaxID=2720871 RepID=A0A8G1QZI3_9EURO|nr:hypothetical protein BO85DRAFT_450634 [Aspergillus piperis CBS 112811]XP_041547614.1 uncharacterized protein AKAW2_70730A [Aspergillus luchuensis]OJZ86261.1 hypothetical protein ASPFODRAFT_32545 [Aspergillus luchuensis CBS 106.47]GAA89395.1 similar to An16g09160 [Aspergillus luchuensis IFO 4308]RAH56604.1 hypothetical protein BO85DRAFT_450634 [Aspergillus piperis CBS 112811]BCS03852.1 hypothetical protein AKAW2_70730A [Aspergillus luchuensis]BCS15465.1 hypothetical protein ALUC_70698A [Asp